METASNIKTVDLLYSPLSMLALNDKQILDELDNLIPYSSAFEIECDMNYDTYKLENFKAIPNIMEIRNDYSEQRYRIPRGIRGIICLYHISRQLKINSLLNPMSSIHYHVDCTECQKKMKKQLAEDKTVVWILSELDTWLGSSKAISRYIGSWYRWNDEHGTTEFRLGEMTFDYNLILKRIVHCNAMVRKIKEDFNPPVKVPDFIPLSLEEKKTILKYEETSLLFLKQLELPLKFKLEKLLKNIEETLKKIDESKESKPVDNIEIKERVHKLF